jgi:hypothetical protein
MFDSIRSSSNASGPRFCASSSMRRRLQPYPDRKETRIGWESVWIVLAGRSSSRAEQHRRNGRKPDRKRIPPYVRALPTAAGRVYHGFLHRLSCEFIFFESFEVGLTKRAAPPPMSASNQVYPRQRELELPLHSFETAVTTRSATISGAANKTPRLTTPLLPRAASGDASQALSGG